MEERCFRMGIIAKNPSSFKQNQVSDFLFSQSFWGHSKQYFNYSLNKHVLGLKNNFIVFNSEHFLEYSNRCGFFCFNTVYNGGKFLFVSSEENYKKLTFFFTVRSFQRFYVDKWVGGLITNNLFDDYVPDVIITSNLKRDTYILKESSCKLIPIVCIEDSDHVLNKSFYSSFANDDKKHSVHLFYKTLTDSMIKSLLFKYSKDMSA